MNIVQNESYKRDALLLGGGGGGGADLPERKSWRKSGLKKRVSLSSGVPLCKIALLLYIPKLYVQAISPMTHIVRSVMMEQSSSTTLTPTTQSAKSVPSALKGLYSDLAPFPVTLSALAITPTVRILRRALHLVTMQNWFIISSLQTSFSAQHHSKEPLVTKD